MKAKVEEGQIDKGRDGSDGSEWFRVQSGVKVKVQGVQSRVLRIKMNCFITKELNYGYGAMVYLYLLGNYGDSSRPEYTMVSPPFLTLLLVSTLTIRQKYF